VTSRTELCVLSISGNLASIKNSVIWVNLYFYWTVEFEKWRSLLLQTADRTSDIPPNQGSIPFHITGMQS
jgi:hypothetical protein